jgi:hypothetical protein
MEKYGKGWIKDYLINNRYADGSLYERQWKEEFDLCIELIAKEATWSLQRKKLLQLSVSANTWVALDQVVSKSYVGDVVLWKECVTTSSKFQGVDEQYYAALLSQMGIFNLLNISLFAAVGLICFGLTDSNSEKLTFFRKLKIYSLEKRLGSSKSIQSLVEDDAEIGTAIGLLFKERVLPYWERENVFFQQLGEDISSMRPIEPYADKWEKIASEYNQALETMKMELVPD